MSPRHHQSDASELRERVLRACALLPGAELTYPFDEDTAVFKVGARMFAVVSKNDEPGQLTLKCNPDYAAFLTQQFDEIIPGYHMNKRHWITITLTPSISVDLVEELTTDSYELIVAAIPVHTRPDFGLRE